jgi:hypothetical protein
MRLIRHRVHLVGLSLFVFSFVSSSTFAQSDPDDLSTVLGEEILAPAAALVQIKSYILIRVVPPRIPASSEHWTEEARRLRRHLLQDVVFHGWPEEWVNSPPKFEDLGAIETHQGYRLHKLRYEIVPGFQSAAIRPHTWPPMRARAAMWRLLFEGQIVQDGLKEYMIPEYMFYDSAHEDENLWVDIGEFVEKRVSGGAKYVSQFGPGWNKYKPHLSEAELKQMKDSVTRRDPNKRRKADRRIPVLQRSTRFDREIARGVQCPAETGLCGFCVDDRVCR